MGDDGFGLGGGYEALVGEKPLRVFIHKIEQSDNDDRTMPIEPKRKFRELTEAEIVDILSVLEWNKFGPVPDLNMVAIKILNK